MSQDNPNRMSIIARIRETVADLAQIGQTQIARTWNLAEDLVLLQGTYPAGKEGAAAFMATAMTETGRGESSVRNLVRAVEYRDGLTGPQRKAVEGWSTDHLLMFGPKVAGKDATKLIREVEKAGAAQNVKNARAVKSRVFPSNRNTSDSAAKTVKLAEKIREAVEKCIADGLDPVAMAAGARLAREHSGDVGDAIIFVASNPAVPAETVAA